MKIKPLEKSDLEMWMNESFSLYASTTSRNELWLRLTVNCFGICRVTLGDEILYEGQGYGQAIRIYNENI